MTYIYILHLFSFQMLLSNLTYIKFMVYKVHFYQSLLSLGIESSFSTFCSISHTVECASLLKHIPLAVNTEKCIRRMRTM